LTKSFPNYLNETLIMFNQNPSIMKKIFYNNLNLMKASLFLIVFILLSTASFGQWTIYNASLTPAGDTINGNNFGISNRQGWSEEEFRAAWTIHEDPDFDGNKFVQFIDTNVDNQGAYRLVWPIEEAPTQMTVVARIRNKDIETVVKGFNIDIDFNLFREEIMIYNNSTIRLRRGTNRFPDAGSQYQPLPEGFDVFAWNIYRFVCDFQGDTPSFKIYLNEDTEIFASSTPTSGGANNRQFRFGNNERAALTAFDLDWLIWDDSGAFAPGEGTALPAELFPSDPSGLTIWDCSVHPLEFGKLVPNNFTTPDVEAFIEWNTIIDDPDVEGNKLWRYYDPSSDYRGMWRWDMGTDTVSKFTMVTRLKGIDLEDFVKAFEVDITLNTGRESVMIHNHSSNTVFDGNGRARLRRSAAADGGGYYNLPEGFSTGDWHIYRFVMNTDDPDNRYFHMYIDEQLVFAASIPGTRNPGGDSFRFGNSEQALRTGFLMDWMVWDITGAYAPWEGWSIPEELYSEVPVKVTVWDCSVHPLEFGKLAPNNYTTPDVETFIEWNTIVDDPDIAGNKLWRYYDPSSDYRGMWSWSMGTDTVSKFTLVTRLRGLDLGDFVKAFEVDIQLNTGRESVMIHNHSSNTVFDGNGRARLRRSAAASGGGYYNLPEGFSTGDWHIYRFVMNTDDPDNRYFHLYIDEQLVFAASIPATRNPGGDSFRFGNSEQALRTGTLMDWMMWDISEAYSPYEGWRIPSELSVNPVEDNALLSDLTIDGITVGFFDPEVLNYEFKRPEFTELPVVGATAHVGVASLKITQAGAAPGDAIVEVTSRDKSVTRVYTISFVIGEAPSGVATLSSLAIDGTAVPGFNAETMSYTVTLPAGTTTVPVVTAVPSDNKALVNITQAPDVPGVASIVVTSEDGLNIITYTIIFEIDTYVNYVDGETFLVYPNPAGSKIHVRLGENFANAEVRLVNMIGKVLKTVKTNNQLLDIDIHDIPIGMYILVIQTDHESVSRLIYKN
jgi:hypothetical protein